MKRGERIFFGLFFRVIPPLGAVWPAMVMNGFEIIRLFSNSMVPETRNTHVLGPLSSIHCRRLPEPWSKRFVTSITLPPLPPRVREPNPSASGKEGIWPWPRMAIPKNKNKKNKICTVRSKARTGKETFSEGVRGKFFDPLSFYDKPELDSTGEITRG